MSEAYNQNKNEILPSGEGLIPNIIRFGHLLKEYGILVPFSSVLDAVKGLPLIDISQIQIFYDLLRCHFVSKKEYLALFDELFWRFWLNNDMRPGACEVRDMSDTACGKEDAEFHEEPNSDLSHSPEPFHRKRSPDAISFKASQALYESIAKLLVRLTRRMGRRYQYASHGRHVSLRRMLRKNMQFGGEPIFLDFKRKKLKKRRVVFFCDVSGSMDVHTLMILQFIHALERIDPRTEIFLFSTVLTRGTRLFRSREFSDAFSKLPYAVADWKGGTRIGHCLRTFNEVHTDIRLSNKTIVIFFSDGWDRGEADLFRDQMAFLKHRTYKIIWLNPAIGSQPMCQGMRTVLPFLDYLLPASSLGDLRMLTNRLENMVIYAD